MKPGFDVLHDNTRPFEFKDKSIAVFNWPESNTVFMQTISSEDIDHLAGSQGLVAHFKIKWKC